MDVDEDQQQSLLNSADLVTDVEITEDIPLPSEEEPIDWTTSLLSEICRLGDLRRLRQFIDFSRQASLCAVLASGIADRLDVETGLSPLHHAARYLQFDICFMLLSNINFTLGVNIKDVHDRTPMHSAFHSLSNISNLERQLNIEKDLGNEIQGIEIWQEEYTTKILLNDHPLIYLFAQANGDVNACDKYLHTPVHYAVTRNNLAGVKQLVKLGAKIESKDRQGIRPLHLACKDGYLSIVEYLIEQGAELDVIDSDQWTPFHYACANGHLEVVKLIELKEKISFQKFIQMKTNTDATCLHLAVQDGNIELVGYILKEFIEDDLIRFINQQAKPLGTPLHIAAKFCEPSMLNFLFHHGADPSILSSNDQSPLHIASALNRLSVIEELYNLTQTSLLEIADDHGRTALSVTTHPDITDQLIAFGADISNLDNNDMNEIMIAVSTGQISIVDRLLSSINDQSILDQVEKRNHRSIFLLAVQTGSIDMCSLLLTHPYIHWDTIDKQRMNLFHIAARYNHHELIKYLSHYIQKSDKFLSVPSRSSNSDPTTLNISTATISPTSSILHLYINAQNEDGKTPLHISCEHGHTLCIQSLLRYNSDILIENHLGQLPFHVAVQNGHSQSVDVLMHACTKYTIDFQSVLSGRQSPLITACQNGHADIVRSLISENIGVDCGMNFDDDDEIREDNPLEIAIKYRRIETIHVLLEHPHAEHWLMAVRDDKMLHQTPLRDMIRYTPECAKHAFDKLILKMNKMDYFGAEFERTVYRYKYIDDYFMDDDKLYAPSSHQLFLNHPFIIALDCEHYSLLDHPLVQQLMLRKWKLYRSLFYFPRIISFLLLFLLTIHVLITPAPAIDVSLSKDLLLSPFIKAIIAPIQWSILILSGILLFKTFLEILLYRGLRVPFAQLFGIISFTSSILAFIPYEKTDNATILWQWQLKSFCTLMQWFNIAIILRSFPFFGIFLFMFQSVLIKFLHLILVISPILIAFTISTKMIFFNQSAFLTIPNAIHKSSAMFIGEFDYETLFFSKPAFTAASVIFMLFVFMITIAFMNLSLGIAVGDIQSKMDKARAKANAYWIRELIYIESTLPSKTWLKSNTPEYEKIDHYFDDATGNNTDQREENKEEEWINHPYVIELGKLMNILDMLCTQAKRVLEQEMDLEGKLKQLLATRKTRGSAGSISNRFLSVT